MPACTLSKQTCVKHVKAKRQVLLLCKRVALVSRNLCFTAELPASHVLPLSSAWLRCGWFPARAKTRTERLQVVVHAVSRVSLSVTDVLLYWLTTLTPSCLRRRTGRDPRRWGKRETIPIATLTPLRLTHAFRRAAT